MAAWDGSGIQDGDRQTRLERLAGTTHKGLECQAKKHALSPQIDRACQIPQLGLLAGKVLALWGKGLQSPEDRRQSLFSRGEMQAPQTPGKSSWFKLLGLHSSSLPFALWSLLCRLLFS